MFLPPSRHRLLPFRFLRWNDDDVLLTNEVGEFLVLPGAALRDLIAHRLPRDSSAYLDLKARHFLADGDSNAALELLARHRDDRVLDEG